MNALASMRSRADLLRALALAGGDELAQRRYANVLEFQPTEHATKSTLRFPPRRPGPALESESALGQATVARALNEVPLAPLRARLFAITGVDYHATEPETRAEALAPLSGEDCRPRPGARPPPFRPLVRAAALWPSLRKSASRHHFAGVDEKHLVRKAARAQPLTTIPRRRRRSWVRPLHVWTDGCAQLIPYQQDFELLLAELQRLYGERDLNEIRFSSAGWGEWPSLPPRDSLVLILSDLGALDRSPAREQRCQAEMANLKRAGVIVSVWAPVSPRQVPAQLAGFAAIHCLEPGAGLRRQPGHWQSEAQRQVEHQRLALLREKLFSLAACAVDVRPPLLRELRQLDDKLRAEPALEALYWSASHRVRDSNVSRAVRARHAPAYRRQLSTFRPEIQRAVLSIMRAQHAVNGASIFAAETILWNAHASAEARNGSDEDHALAHARQFFRRLNEHALPDSSNTEAIRYAADLLDRVGEDEPAMETHVDLFAPLHAISGQRRIPPGLDANVLLRARSRRYSVDFEGEWLLVQKGDEIWAWPESASLDPQTSRISSAEQSAEMIVLKPSAPGRSFRMDRSPISLGRMTECRIVTARKTLRIGGINRPDWAHELGRDEFGLYADLKIKSITQRFRWIDPGEFLMGSPEDEAERYDDEGPRHRVRLSEGFWLADSACTQEFWLVVLGGKNPSHFQDDPQCPVEQVSWDDVQDFLHALGEHLPPGARPGLPTEAQWEYACRAGTRTPFSFGENITPEQVNYDGNYPYHGGKKGKNRERTVPVKSLPQNRWGLYEMHGNVWEWCADGSRKYEAVPEGEAVLDPEGPGDSASRVLRGGSWLYRARYSRSADRLAYGRDRRTRFIGFRLALRSTSTGQDGPEDRV